MAKEFITALFTLAENCNFRDELIQDRIVVGIKGRALSGQLQLEAFLRLEKAMRQREAVKVHWIVFNKTVATTDTPDKLNSIKAKTKIKQLSKNQFQVM